MDIRNIAPAILNGYSLTIFVVILAVFFLVTQATKTKMDPQEPPLVHPLIPVVGHAIGLWRKNMVYFHDLCARYPSYPMYTISIFGSKTYVVADTGLMQTAFRNVNLSLLPLVVEFAARIVNISPKTVEVLNEGLYSEDPKHVGYFKEVNNQIHNSLKPGTPALEHLTRRILDEIPLMLNPIGPEWQNKGSLFGWLQQKFALAVTSSLFGRAHNPFLQDRTLIQSLWDFDYGQLKLVMGQPSWMARKAWTGRARVQRALLEYYRAGYDQEEASALVRERSRIHRNRGIPVEEIAKMEITIPQAANSNAVPTLFWFLVYIFSDLQLVKDIRSEIQTITSKGKEKEEMIIDARLINDECPLLVSVYQETLRMVNYQTGIRVVMTDTTISAGPYSYLLKKGGVLQMPAGVLHHSSEVWGSKVDEFDGRRFLKMDSLSSEEKEADKAQKKSYIPFGGGKHLCPGRHLAFTEILAVAAAFVIGIDMLDEDGKELIVPTEKQIKFAEGVMRPCGKSLELKVKMRRRRGFENVKWSFAYGASD